LFHTAKIILLILQTLQLLELNQTFLRIKCSLNVHWSSGLGTGHTNGNDSLNLCDNGWFIIMILCWTLPIAVRHSSEQAIRQPNPDVSPSGFLYYETGSNRTDKVADCNTFTGPSG
jgi:hypothetical protein